jgi:hypothetical protein
MKKLLTICLIMATAFTVNAQGGKPTKEETVAFINRTLNECKGFKLPYYMGTMQNVDFSENKLIYTTILTVGVDGKKDCDHKEIYENINWSKLKMDQMEFNQETDYFSYYHIRFSTNLNKTTNNENCSFRENSKKTNIQSNMYVFIPTEKKESIKKAFLRLSEIAKEENKDPFQN